MGYVNTENIFSCLRAARFRVRSLPAAVWCGMCFQIQNEVSVCVCSCIYVKFMGFLGKDSKNGRDYVTGQSKLAADNFLRIASLPLLFYSSGMLHNGVVQHLEQSA